MRSTFTRAVAAMGRVSFCGVSRCGEGGMPTAWTMACTCPATADHRQLLYGPCAAEIRRGEIVASTFGGGCALALFQQLPDIEGSRAGVHRQRSPCAPAGVGAALESACEAGSMQWGALLCRNQNSATRSGTPETVGTAGQLRRRRPTSDRQQRGRSPCRGALHGGGQRRAARSDIWAYLRDVLERLATGGVEPPSCCPTPGRNPNPEMVRVFRGHEAANLAAAERLRRNRR